MMMMVMMRRREHINNDEETNIYKMFNDVGHFATVFVSMSLLSFEIMH